MKAGQQINKPDNWDDFENLCQQLWGEIWKCDEIQRNGRKGQSQNGVDVYGMPSGKTQYYGIQCKCKSGYTDSRITKNEIDTEIANAVEFQPPLAKLYFATTANKDSTIEEYVRLKNVEHKTKKMFEVYLYSWEDIVRLIHQNRQTYDYYVRSINFNTEYDIEVTFDNKETHQSGTVTFVKKYIHHKLADPNVDALFGRFDRTPLAINNTYLTHADHSYHKFRILLENIGSSPINNPKLILKVLGEYTELADRNFPLLGGTTDISINEKNNEVSIEPARTVLTLEDKYESGTIYLKPIHEDSTLELEWKFTSDELTRQGKLFLQINVNFKRIDEVKKEYNPAHVRVEGPIIEDHLS